MNIIQQCPILPGKNPAITGCYTTPGKTTVGCFDFHEYHCPALKRGVLLLPVQFYSLLILELLVSLCQTVLARDTSTAKLSLGLEVAEAIAIIALSCSIHLKV